VPTLYARAMRRAAEILGESELAAHLSVSEVQLRWWMQGVAVPPGDVFLKIADILAEDSLEKIKHRDRSSESGTDADVA
jgi:predicted transcriptional regulator